MVVFLQPLTQTVISFHLYVLLQFSYTVFKQYAYANVIMASCSYTALLIATYLPSPRSSLPMQIYWLDDLHESECLPFPAMNFLWRTYIGV